MFHSCRSFRLRGRGIPEIYLVALTGSPGLGTGGSVGGVAGSGSGSGGTPGKGGAIGPGNGSPGSCTGLGSVVRMANAPAFKFFIRMDFSLSLIICLLRGSRHESSILATASNLLTSMNPLSTLDRRFAFDRRIGRGGCRLLVRWARRVAFLGSSFLRHGSHSL